MGELNIDKDVRLVFASPFLARGKTTSFFSSSPFLLFSGVNAARAQVGQDDGPVVAEVQEGKRSGSINYVIGNKLYIKESIYNENLLAHCIHKRRGCRARATLCKDTLEVKSSSKHSCDTDAIHIAKGHSYSQGTVGEQDEKDG